MTTHLHIVSIFELHGVSPPYVTCLNGVVTRHRDNSRHVLKSGKQRLFLSEASPRIGTLNR
jgi:hypothetical protein